MKNIFVVGTGPGASEYLTLQAVTVLKNAHLIFAPNNKGKQTALNTVSEFITKKRIILLDFPMGSVTKETYRNASETIITETENGTSSVFLTIGDPMLYSTFVYLLPYLKRPGINLKIIPGIPSYTAAAAVAQIPLTKKGECLTVTDHLNSSIVKNSDSIVLLKMFDTKNTAIGEFEKNNFRYVYVKRVSLKGETVLTAGDERIISDDDYMSLMLARKKGADIK